MNYGALLNSIPFECKRLLRKIESEEKRLIGLRLSQQFINNCLTKNFLPKCVNYEFSYFPKGTLLANGTAA